MSAKLEETPGGNKGKRDELGRITKGGKRKEKKKVKESPKEEK